MDDIDIKKLAADYSRVIISNDPDEILARFLIGDYVVVDRFGMMLWGVFRPDTTITYEYKLKLCIPKPDDITCYYSHEVPVYLYQGNDLWTVILSRDKLIELLKEKFYGWQPD